MIESKTMLWTSFTRTTHFFFSLAVHLWQTHSLSKLILPINILKKCANRVAYKTGRVRHSERWRVSVVVALINTRVKTPYNTQKGPYFNKNPFSILGAPSVQWVQNIISPLRQILKIMHSQKTSKIIFNRYKNHIEQFIFI